MTASEPSQPAIDRPRSSETVAVLEFPTLSALGEDSSTTPPGRMIARVAFLVALLACLLWGVVEIRELLAVPHQAPRAAQSVVGKSSVDPSTDPSAGTDEVDDMSLPGRRASLLLHTRVEQVGDDGGKVVEIAESGAIAVQAVTVVNLWATWCPPCRAELPGFKKMFAANARDRGWSSETRFVPILVDDPTPASKARRDIVNDMPPIHAFLVDHKLDDGGVRGALVAIDVIKTDASLPVTLVFDCRRRIRWIRVGALDEAAFTALTAEIDQARGELGTNTCKPRRPVKPQPDPSSDRGPCDRDGECEPERGEDCDRCPRDCGCPSGRRCLVRPTPELSRCMEEI